MGKGNLFFSFLEDMSPFRGATDTPVLDFCDIYPRFQSQGGGSLACFLTCVILRFTSCVTPAACMEVSMAAKPFQSTYLQTCPKALVGVGGESNFFYLYVMSLQLNPGNPFRTDETKLEILTVHLSRTAPSCVSRNKVQCAVIKFFSPFV